MLLSEKCRGVSDGALTAVATRFFGYYVLNQNDCNAPQDDKTWARTARRGSFPSCECSRVEIVADECPIDMSLPVMHAEVREKRRPPNENHSGSRGFVMFFARHTGRFFDGDGVTPSFFSAG